MSVQKTTNSRSLAISRLLAAISSPDSDSGSSAVPDRLLGLIHAAAKRWPYEPFDSWLSELEHHKEVGDPGDEPEMATHRIGSPTTNLVSFWSLAVSPMGMHATLDALLGRALVVAAINNAPSPASLFKGAGTLLSAVRNKGRFHESWRTLFSADVCDVEAVSATYRTVDFNTPAARFLDSVKRVLETPIVPPAVLELHVVDECVSEPIENPDTIDTGTRADAKTPSRVVAAFSLNEDLDNTDDRYPNISARFLGADYAPFYSKLGITGRDSLALADFRILTRNLARYLTQPSGETVAFAALALTSALTGCEDVQCLQLEFKPRHSIWLDLQLGAWAWDFGCYRNSQHTAESNSTSVEPVFIALPQALADKLRVWANWYPNTQTLGQLLEEVAKTPIALKTFREFVRRNAPTAHPPYRARLRNSIAAACLEITGSDMTTSILTGQFTATAPAALYYYALSPELQESRTSLVYAELGLGQPTKLPTLPRRWGSHKLLAFAEFRSGWVALISAIEGAMARFHAATTAKDQRQAANEIMLLTCAAFVVVTGHRGTKIERLTFAALLACDDAILISDKDDLTRSEPRLLPKTPWVAFLISCALVCWNGGRSDGQLIARGCGVPGGSDPLFQVHELDAPEASQRPLRTSDVEQVIRRYFSSDVNFGRSQWVTLLDAKEEDRWLNRVLTGHTRDVTRTNSAYMDVAPLSAARMLGTSLESVGSELLGKAPVHNGDIRYTPWTFSIHGVSAAIPDPLRVPDPRTTLSPLGEETLVGHRVAAQIRMALMDGSINASNAALTVMHLLFIDLIPAAWLALMVVIQDKSVPTKEVLGVTYIGWQRAHFSDLTWIPLLPTSAQLLRLARAAPANHDDVLSEVSRMVANFHEAHWPATVEGRLNALMHCAASFKRLEFPPSLLGVGDPKVPAPAFSMQAIQRLAGSASVDIATCNALRADFARRPFLRLAKDSEVKVLLTVLDEYTSTTDRLGEKIERAKKAKEAIQRKLDSPGAPSASWISSWVLEELSWTRSVGEGCHEVSTIGTYLRAFRISESKPAFDVDIADWYEDDWTNWLGRLAVAHQPIPEGKALPKQEQIELDAAIDIQLPDAARHPLLALIKSLDRRSISIPDEVREIAGVGDPLKPRGSYSSCWISSADIEAAVELVLPSIAEYPLDQVHLKIRSVLTGAVPLRPAEISNLSIDCLTESNQLVVQRAGYSSIKNENAVRLIPLDETTSNSLRELRAQVLRHVPDATLLVRGDGTSEYGERDEALGRIFAIALKSVTGDLRATERSIRASTAQRLCWPAYEHYAKQLLNGDLSPRDACRFLQEVHRSWTRMSATAAMAGHAHLGAIWGYYLSAHAIVGAIVATALMEHLRPGPKLLVQLGLSPDAFRTAKSRKKHALREVPVEHEFAHDFDAWAWVQSKCKPERDVARESASSPTAGPAQSRQPASQLAIAPAPPVAHPPVVTSARYLALRALEYSAENAQHALGIPASHALTLENSLISPEIVWRATGRRHSGGAGAQGLRGLKADARLLLSPEGIAIAEWVIEKGGPHLLTVSKWLRKIHTHDAPPKPDELSALLSSIDFHKNSKFRLGVRLGTRQFNAAAVAMLQTRHPKIMISSNHNQGGQPDFFIAPAERENAVMQARMTSVFKLLVAALDCLQKGGQR